MSVRIIHQKSNIDSFVLPWANNHLQIFAEAKTKTKQKCSGISFLSVFEKIIMTPFPAHLSWGDPFWCKTLDSVVEQSSGIDFMLETLRRKFILVGSTFNKYACAQMVYNFGCSKILQRRPVEAVFIILQKDLYHKKPLESSENRSVWNKQRDKT